jgi:DNA-binding transcriptional regulator GbsR (MarR family)
MDDATYNYITDEAKKRDISKSKVHSQIVSDYCKRGISNEEIIKATENNLKSLIDQLNANKTLLELNDRLVTQLQSEKWIPTSRTR